jgi:hypothetical protein
MVIWFIVLIGLLYIGFYSLLRVASISDDKIRRFFDEDMAYIKTKKIK